MATRTVAKITHHGTYRVVFNDKEPYAPYTIYHEWYDQGKHSKRLESYENLKGCLWHLHYIIEA